MELSIRPDEWAMVKEQAAILVNSGMLPGQVNTPQKAIAIMLKGRELGFPPMASFSHINIIKGKPALSAEAMLALIYRRYPKAEIEFLQNNNDLCEIAAIKNGKKNKFSFTMQDAQTAKLLGNDNWQLYPRAMLRSRCVSEMARSMFPECLMGCSYTEEELEETPETVQPDEQKAIEPPKKTETVVLYSHDRKDHNELLAGICEKLNVTEQDHLIDLSEKADHNKVPLMELGHFLKSEIQYEKGN